MVRVPPHGWVLTPDIDAQDGVGHLLLLSPPLAGFVRGERARARLGLWWAVAFVRTGADRSSWRRMPQGARRATPHHAAARSARIICRRRTACGATRNRVAFHLEGIGCVVVFVCLFAQHGRQTNFRNLKRNGQNHKAPEVLQGSQGYSLQGTYGCSIQGSHGCSIQGAQASDGYRGCRAQTTCAA